ncbi:MAG: 5-deoxy-glucuronate isomerase [Chloroflexota bacterium]
MTDIATPGLHRRAGELANGPWSLDIDPVRAGWSFSGLRVAALAPRGSVAFETGLDEVAILPLEGSFSVVCGDDAIALAGRSGVFAGSTDFAYAPPGSRLVVASETGGRFAVPAARADRGRPFRRVAASEVPIELRGAGASSREVRNFCAAHVFDAERLIAVEVLTPGGNWGSYPPHKHDEAGPGESVLEEVYFYEVRPGPTGPGVAYQRVYGTPDRPIDVLAEVRSGDVVLIPHGWHGPAMAPPGYDLYYLNVMAGPGERAWLARDDPEHAWVKDRWPGEPIDPRLPFGGRASASGTPPQ